MKKLSKEAAELLLTISNNEELQAFAKELYPELGKKQLPKSWEDLRIKGFYVDISSNIKESDDYFSPSEYDKNVFANKEQAEASIAMSQLSQLMKVYNDGWEADYLDGGSVKYGIGYFGEKLKVGTVYSTRYFLVFKDEETAELFIENFKELIEQAKPLL
jgi:hypothetical protein